MKGLWVRTEWDGDGTDSCGRCQCVCMGVRQDRGQRTANSNNRTRLPASYTHPTPIPSYTACPSLPFPSHPSHLRVFSHHSSLSLTPRRTHRCSPASARLQDFPSASTVNHSLSLVRWRLGCYSRMLVYSYRRDCGLYPHTRQRSSPLCLHSLSLPSHQEPVQVPPGDTRATTD